MEGFPVKTFMEKPTIEALARIIDASITRPSSLVVPLQPLGAQPPLFLIHHSGGGYVFFYRALAAHLGPDRPVYGVRAETRSDGLGLPFDRSKSIEELAARYIVAIKTIYPNGPYSLGGACWGGVVAFEMARQLREQGEEIAGPVLLFDAYLRNDSSSGDTSAPPSNSWLEGTKHKIAFHWARASQIGRVKAVWYLLRTIVNTVRRRMAFEFLTIYWNVAEVLGMPAPNELLETSFLERFMKVSIQTLQDYKPQVYDGSIVLFKAADGNDPSPNWNGLAQKSMIVVEVPGKHLERMFDEPVVTTTAALVRKYLNP
jgi:thioesterase domain-containing protein